MSVETEGPYGYNNGSAEMIGLPKVIWRWDVFGGGLVIANITFVVPRWRRLLTRIFLGSVWTRL